MFHNLLFAANFVNLGLSSVLRAAGVFFFIAAEWFVIYYVFALPICVALMYYAGWGLKGYWVPFCIGCVIEIVPMLMYVLCLNWKRVIETQEALKTKAPTDTKENGNMPTNNSIDTTDGCSSEIESTGEKSFEMQDREPAIVSLHASGPISQCGSHSPPVITHTSLMSLSFSERNPSQKIEVHEKRVISEEADEEDGEEGKQMRRLAILLWLAPVVLVCALSIGAALALRLLRPQILPLETHVNNTLFNQTHTTRTESSHLYLLQTLPSFST